MPTDKCIIKSYDLQSTQDGPEITRKLDLVSETVKGTVFFRVSLVSLPENPWKMKGRIGAVSNYQAQNFDPISLSAWLDPQVFDSFYAVLSGESPVTFSFDYIIDPAKPKSTTKYLQSVRLGTGDEKPGDFEKTGIASKLANIFKQNTVPG